MAIAIKRNDRCRIVTDNGIYRTKQSPKIERVHTLTRFVLVQQTSHTAVLAVGGGGATVFKNNLSLSLSRGPPEMPFLVAAEVDKRSK